MSKEARGIVALGKITGAYGVSGWVRVRPFGGDAELWRAGTYWICADDASAEWCQLEVRQWRQHGDALLAKIDGVSDRGAAETLRANVVGMPRCALPEVDQDEYYWADLIGLAVFGPQGEHLGLIAEMLETGANDVMRVIDDDATERLIPFVGAVVSSVDLGAGKVIVEWGADW